MERILTHLLDQFEAGDLNRRELISTLTFLTAATAGTLTALSAENEESSFKATGLNHIALRVTDVRRSRDFYVKHLGMKVTRDSDSSCFLTFGDHFLALFRGNAAEMDHYCYSVEDYDVQKAAEKLKSLGLEPEVHGQRIYFKDPDGLTVQLAANDHQP